MVIFCHFKFCHIRKKSFQLKLRKLREVTVSTIQNYNGVHSLFVWLPSSREKKKYLPLVHNHIYVQPHYFINFDLFLIKLDLFTVDIALSCHQQKTTVFTTVFTFFSCHRNLLLLFPSCNLYFYKTIILWFEWNLWNSRSKI